MSEPNETPLCLASTDEIVDELMQRHRAAVVVLDAPNKTGDEDEGGIMHWTNGSPYWCIGLADAALRRLQRWDDRLEEEPFDDEVE